MVNKKIDNDISKTISLEEARKLYESVKNKYEQLGLNIENSLKILLHTNNIEYRSIIHRTKTLDSFIDKITRKEYIDPLNQMEDICGIRVVCFFLSDLEKVDRIIGDEFEVVETIDKSDLLKPNEFGYRSHHYIVQIKKDWMVEPNYRGLDGYKAEIQVRTILEDAWADIQHKLVYKHESQVPTVNKRKFAQVMALLEQADESFDTLKLEKTNYVEEVNTILRRDSDVFDKILERNLPLNIDTFRSVLSLIFPDREIDEQGIVTVFNEIAESNLSINSVIKSYLDGKGMIDSLDVPKESIGGGKLTQPQIMRRLLYATNPHFRRYKDKKRIKELENIGRMIAVSHYENQKKGKITRP